MKTEKKMDGKSSIKRENFSLHKALKHTYLSMAISLKIGMYVFLQ